MGVRWVGGLVKRCEFLTFVDRLAVGTPFAAGVQALERIRRVGVLIDLAESDPEGQARIAVFRRGLAELELD